MDLADANALAGIVALINSMVVVPAVMALRKIAARHDDAIRDLDYRVGDLEYRRPRRRRLPK